MKYEIGTFNTIQPTPFEHQTGMILTQANLVFLQNLRAQYAQEVLNLEIDINKVQEYAIALASLQSNIKLISYLIDSHNAQMLALEQNQVEVPEL